MYTAHCFDCQLPCQLPSPAAAPEALPGHPVTFFIMDKQISVPSADCTVHNAPEFSDSSRIYLCSSRSGSMLCA